MPLDRSSSTGAGSLGNEEVEEDRALLPGGVGVGQNLRQERIRPSERLRLGLEVDLAILIQRVSVHGDAGVQYGIQLISIRAGEIASDQIVHLLGGVNPCGVQVRLEIVELVRIGLLGQDRRAVVVREGFADRVCVVHEVEHEDIVLLRMGPVQA